MMTRGVTLDPITVTLHPIMVTLVPPCIPDPHRACRDHQCTWEMFTLKANVIMDHHDDP